MPKTKRYWSLSMLLDMLRRDNFVVSSNTLRRLTGVQWNSIGEWVYYRLHPQDKDPVKDRPVPPAIGTIIHRKEIRDWTAILGGPAGSDDDD